MYEVTLTDLCARREEAACRLQAKQEEERPLYAELDAAEAAIMRQVLQQLHDGGNFIVLAAQVHGVTEASQSDMVNLGRSLADRLSRYFQNMAYSVKWPDSSQ